MSKNKKLKPEQGKGDNQIQITNMELRAFFVPMAFGDQANTRLMSTPYLDIMTSKQSKDLSGKAKAKLMRLDLRIQEQLKIIEDVRKGMIDKYCKKDGKGEAILKRPDIGRDPKKKFSPEEEEAHQKMLESIPKDRWTHDFEDESRKLFNKEFEDLLNDNADIQGEKITLHPDDLPEGFLTPTEMGNLSKIINFVE